MCVIQIIYNPLSYILSLGKEEISQILTFICNKTGFDITSNTAQLFAVTEIQGGFSLNNSCSGATAELIKALNMDFLGFDLSATPFTTGGIMYIVPFLAGLSALALCLFQNIKNPLQAEQSRFEQIGTNAISIGISLILGGFVPAGIGFYWICSNLLTMVQQLILNSVMNPKNTLITKNLKKARSNLKNCHRLVATTHQNEEQSYINEKNEITNAFSLLKTNILLFMLKTVVFTNILNES